MGRPKKIQYRRHSDYEKKKIEPEWINMKIIVSTEEEKEELIKASQYIHDFIVWDKKDIPNSLDSDIMMVNYLMHVYESPDLCIKVDPTIFNRGKELENNDDLKDKYIEIAVDLLEKKYGKFIGITHTEFYNNYIYFKFWLDDYDHTAGTGDGCITYEDIEKELNKSIDIKM